MKGRVIPPGMLEIWTHKFLQIKNLEDKKLKIKNLRGQSPIYHDYYSKSVIW